MRSESQVRQQHRHQRVPSIHANLAVCRVRGEIASQLHHPTDLDLADVTGFVAVGRRISMHLCIQDVPPANVGDD